MKKNNENPKIENNEKENKIINIIIIIIFSFIFVKIEINSKIEEIKNYLEIKFEYKNLKYINSIKT